MIQEKLLRIMSVELIKKKVFRIRWKTHNHKETLTKKISAKKEAEAVIKIDPESHITLSRA